MSAEERSPLLGPSDCFRLAETLEGVMLRWHGDPDDGEAVIGVANEIARYGHELQALMAPDPNEPSEDLTGAIEAGEEVPPSAAQSARERLRRFGRL